jgi:hypothetical protein
VTSNPRELARELVTAHWTAFERRTGGAGVYQASIERAVEEDPETAVDVLHELARIAVMATVFQAAARDVPYEDALAEVYRQLESPAAQPAGHSSARTRTRRFS